MRQAPARPSPGAATPAARPAWSAAPAGSPRPPAAPTRRERHPGRRPPNRRARRRTPPRRRRRGRPRTGRRRSCHPRAGPGRPRPAPRLGQRDRAAAGQGPAVARRQRPGFRSAPLPRPVHRNGPGRLFSAPALRVAGSRPARATGVSWHRHHRGHDAVARTRVTTCGIRRSPSQTGTTGDKSSSPRVPCPADSASPASCEVYRCRRGIARSVTRITRDLGRSRSG